MHKSNKKWTEKVAFIYLRVCVSVCVHEYVCEQQQRGHDCEREQGEWYTVRTGEEKGKEDIYVIIF